MIQMPALITTLPLLSWRHLESILKKRCSHEPVTAQQSEVFRNPTKIPYLGRLHLLRGRHLY